MENMMALQRDEATSYEVYRRLSQVEKGPANRDVLLRIAADEKRHYALLRTRTGRDVRPARGKVWFYVLLARVLGVTFAVRRMELGEKDAGRLYANYPDMEDFVGMARDEERHEQELIGLIDEERLAYMGSVVLGLNDALVEFTGSAGGLHAGVGRLAPDRPDGQHHGNCGSPFDGLVGILVDQIGQGARQAAGQSGDLYRHRLCCDGRGAGHAFRADFECPCGVGRHAGRRAADYCAVQLLLCRGAG